MSVDAAQALLGWYDRNARALSWRAPPGDHPRPPYEVWLSEIMLQQTTTAAVRPYFAEFLRRWPTVADLAAADEAEVMRAWAGLGYYARARNLIRCAQVIVSEHGGRFPDTETGLRALPGIGAYTAASVAAIAFGKRAVVVDANVERVVARLFAVETPLPLARRELYQLTDSITPGARAGDFAQAMMDLGATICTSRSPMCILCPLAQGCAARARGEAERFPIKPPRRAKPHRHGIAYWLEHDGRVLLRRRPGKGLLGGMNALPSGAWGEVPVDAPPIEAQWRPIGTVNHVFTHFSLDLHLHGAVAEGATLEGLWWPIADIDAAGLPTLFAKAVALARAMREEIAA